MEVGDLQGFFIEFLDTIREVFVSMLSNGHEMDAGLAVSSSCYKFCLKSVFRAAKFEMLPGGSFVNQVRASPFKVVEKNLHHAASLPICTLICALNTAR